MATTKNESASDCGEPSSASPKLPPGNYCIIGWDMDTTGRRYIDEICQIAGYTPSSQFAQYIMPNGYLMPASRRRHNIRVVTIGRYRLLTSNTDNKMLKTKSEISALTDFISWLEMTKGETDEGVILISHEPRKTLPYMLIEALRRFNLLDRFKDTVKGFSNGFALAELKCPSPLNSYGLEVVTRVLLDKRGSLASAMDRARLVYQVAQHLTQDKKKEDAGCSGDPGIKAKQSMIDAVRAHTQTVAAEDKELDVVKEVIERQKTFRPIFQSMLSTNRFVRQKATILRRILAEGGLDYSALNEAYKKSAKVGLEEQLTKLKMKKKEQYTDLLKILDSHFNPKKAEKPSNPSRPRRRNVRAKKNKTEGEHSSGDGKNGSGTSSPSTSSSVKEGGSTSVTSSNATPPSGDEQQLASEDSN